MLTFRATSFKHLTRYKRADDEADIDQAIGESVCRFSYGPGPLSVFGRKRHLQNEDEVPPAALDFARRLGAAHAPGRIFAADAYAHLLESARGHRVEGVRSRQPCPLTKNLQAASMLNMPTASP